MKKGSCLLMALLLVGCATAKIEKLSQIQTLKPVISSSQKVFVSLS